MREFADVEFCNIDFGRDVYCWATFMNCSFNDCRFDSADFHRASFRDCSFESCDLYSADFTGTYFFNCRFAGVYSTGDATLHGAYFDDASVESLLVEDSKCDRGLIDLYDTGRLLKSLVELQRMPSEGAFVAWVNIQPNIVKLIVPADAMRVTSPGGSCRVSKAVVAELQPDWLTRYIEASIEESYPREGYSRREAEVSVGDVLVVEGFREDRVAWVGDLRVYMSPEEAAYNPFINLFGSEHSVRKGGRIEDVAGEFRGLLASV